jgi:ABC-2 type transport system permease protein
MKSQNLTSHILNLIPMFKHTIKYEWLNLLRDRWVVILLILFLGITLFAVRNGKDKVSDRLVGIAREKEKLAKLDKEIANDIDSLTRNLKPKPEPWLDNRLLFNVGWDAARVVAMDAQPLAIVSTGQSDLFSHYAKPKIYGEAYTLGFSELSNPVQLLFGSFDLAFVCIYLLPLLVLAFSYNILSSEKESGVLRLTIAQPISLYRWLFGKLLVRFFILSGIILISILLSLSLFGVSVIGNAAVTGKLMLIITAYTFFWFLIAFLVNLLGSSSGGNAVTLVAVWVVLVLLVPSVISQTATSAYPIPSRTIMIHQYREAKALAEKKADEILKTYYRDHPELAPKDTTNQSQYSWWLGYFASSDLVNQSVKPVLDNYNKALSEQQSWVNTLRFLSPAILLQDAMNDLAGTSSAHYADFRNQVIGFADTWRNYFMPRMFKNETMKPEDLASLPQHTYSTNGVPSNYGADFLGIFFFLAFAMAGSVWVYRRNSFESVLSI